MASRSARPTRGCAGWWAGAEVGQRGSRRPCCRPRSTTRPGTRTSSYRRAPTSTTPSPPWRPPVTGPGSRNRPPGRPPRAPCRAAPATDPEDVEVRSLRQRLAISAALTAPVLALAMIPALQFTYWQWRRCRAARSRRVRPAGLPGTPAPGRRRALGRGPGLAARVATSPPRRPGITEATLTAAVGTSPSVRCSSRGWTEVVGDGEVVSPPPCACAPAAWPAEQVEDIAPTGSAQQARGHAGPVSPAQYTTTGRCGGISASRPGSSASVVAGVEDRAACRRPRPHVQQDRGQRPDERGGQLSGGQPAGAVDPVRSGAEGHLGLARVACDAVEADATQPHGQLFLAVLWRHQHDLLCHHHARGLGEPTVGRDVERSPQVPCRELVRLARREHRPRPRPAGRGPRRGRAGWCRWSTGWRRRLSSAS